MRSCAAGPSTREPHASIVTVANQEIRLATSMMLGVQATRTIFFVAAAAISGTIGARLAAVALLGGVLTADDRAAITSNVRRATGRVPRVAALAVPIAVREQ